MMIKIHFRFVNPEANYDQLITKVSLKKLVNAHFIWESIATKFNSDIPICDGSVVRIKALIYADGNLNYTQSVTFF